MSPPAFLVDVPAAKSDRRAILVFAIVILVVSIALWRYRTILFAPSAAFFGAYGALLVLCEALIALVLAARARALNDARTGVLALAYAFSAPLVFGNVISLPTVAGIHFHYQTPPWMWLFWHVGWAAAVAVFAWRVSPRRLSVRYCAVFGLLAAGACIALAINAGALLPPLLEPDGSWTLPLVAGYGVALAFNAVALAGFARRSARLSTLELSVVLAVVAAIGEIGFISTSLVRFSLGTYAGRLLSVISGLAVLFSLASDYLAATRRTLVLERHAALADASPEIVYMTDAKGSCTYVNRRWTEVTGQSAGEALGNGWRAMFHSPDAELDREGWDRDLAAGVPHQHELRFRTADGALRWHRSRATPLRDDAGNVIAWLGTAIDIEDHRRAFDDIRIMYERERRVAETLQGAFLPPFLPNLAGLRFEAAYRAAETRAEIGGDWYDAFPTHDGRIAFSVGDVMGHGFEAASSMIRVRETIRAAAVSLEARPADVIAFANRALCRAAGEALATAVFAVYDTASGLLSYSSAGHPRPILRRRGEATFLEAGGIAMGIDAATEYPTHELTLEPHDALAIYTDGLIENTRDLVDGEARMLAAFDGTSNAQQIVDKVLVDGQRDDVALLVMEVAGKATAPDATALAWRFHCDDPESARSARASFVEYLGRRGVKDEALAGAELVFGELLANAVRHAPGPIDISLSWEDLVPVLTVSDRGPGIREPAGAKLPDDVLAQGGRGLFLVRALAGDPSISQRSESGTEIAVPLLIVSPES